jgi:NAD(P)-dependent dehydrogenase (short-subunit alcohol dehydrogenase family)
VIVGRDEQKLKDAKDKLGELCYPVACDLSDLASIPGLVEDIIKKMGQVDILVNNAGINMKKEFTEVTDEEFQKVITTNLCSVFAISREVVKQMLIQKSDGMTRAMAVELSPKGIRINAIAPGFIVTAMTDTALNADPERKGKVFGRTPMGYMGQPSDIGDAALFLASDASKYITGVILPVDGGNSIGF